MKKVCVVTGGSSGIGLSIVKKFIAEGFTVFNIDRQASEIGIYRACDITKVAQVDKIIKDIANEHHISALVSNAGIHYSGNIEVTTEDDLETVFNINVKGAYAAIKAVLPSMKKHKYGAIVLIASDQALIGKRNSFAYNLSKTALASMAKTTALDYAPFNITANAVCPGTIETPLYHQAINKYCEKSGANKAEVHQEEQQLQPLGRLGQPEEVADLVYFMCSEQARFITGSLQVIDGGYTAQ
ncbi:SDR family NAD(P)-dependent oxidoreductase [Thalassotalea atypica]|uniref:SDR family NAD(P)-dependent oxidoreductase n=1 Tax=Thalassotalea atypica TaxID=2054316 RepID=UPI002573BE93|nr:SDR family oxidoreductase [Thalassotalea atypica]